MSSWAQYFNGSKRGRVPPDELAFDTENPRFTPDKHPDDGSDGAIIAYLDRTADLSELIQSIAASGYVDIEPLIVIARGSQLVVLEGNRRLAAIRVLTTPRLAEAANVGVPEITAAVRASMKEVSVFKVDAPDEARNLIGFKHINGPQGWDAYAKALFAARWLDEEVSKGEHGISLTDIAARMGDNHDTLYRIVSAVYVLQQAESLELFDVADRAKRHFSFSHLYTALTYSEFREFIGLGKADRSANPERNPVDEPFYGALRQLMLWLYGSRAERVEPAIKTQAPGLSELKKVLGHSVARKVMLERNDLPEALRLTFEGRERFSKSLIDARAALESATQELTNAELVSEMLFVSDDVLKRAQLIHSVISSRMMTRDGVEQAKFYEALEKDGAKG